MRHFLLIYDARSGKLRDQREFSRSASAVRAYQDAEAQYRDDPYVQVVLVGADSIATVRVTHRNFFRRHDISDLVQDVLQAK